MLVGNSVALTVDAQFKKTQQVSSCLGSATLVFLNWLPVCDVLQEECFPMHAVFRDTGSSLGGISGALGVATSSDGVRSLCSRTGPFPALFLLVGRFCLPSVFMIVVCVRAACFQFHRSFPT